MKIHVRMINYHHFRLRRAPIGLRNRITGCLPVKETQSKVNWFSIIAVAKDLESKEHVKE